MKNSCLWSSHDVFTSCTICVERRSCFGLRRGLLRGLEQGAALVEEG